MRVLVFGASITQGFWDTEGGWVARLRKYYDEKQVKDLKNNDEPTVMNLGDSGATVQDLLKRFKPETEARKRDELAFIISIGTNNAAEGMERGFDPIGYKENLTKVVGRAKEYSDKILLVGLPSCDESRTTPVFWRDVYYTNDRIKAIEVKMNEVAKEQGLTFVPVFDEFKTMQETGPDILPDGLHPNNDGHQFIYSLVRPELDKLFTKQ